MQQSNNYIQVDIPVVILVGTHDEKIAKTATEQSYKNKTVKIISWGDTLDDFYNRAIEKELGKNVVFVLLDDNHIFASQNIVSQIAYEFMNDDNLCILYSDSYVLNGNVLIPQYLPSFDLRKFTDGSLAINNAFAIRSQFLTSPPFSPNIKNLYYYYVIRKLAVQRAKIEHLAEPLFIIKPIQFDPSEDISKLNE